MIKIVTSTPPIERLKPKGAWKGQPFEYADEKIDGFRMSIHMTHNGNMWAWGRKLEDHLMMGPKLDHLIWYRMLRRVLPYDTMIDGELYVPGQPASYVSHALAEQHNTLSYVAFAMPIMDGADLREDSLAYGKLQLNRLLGKIEGVRISRHLAMPIVSQPAEDTKRCLLEQADELNIEGFVLKTKHYEGPWYKVKRQQTVDCIVTGFKDGEGKYLGNTGALIVSLYDQLGELVEVARVSGMTDEVRDSIDERKDMHRVCEVEYQEVGARGRLRHPRFIRWRDDKAPIECSIFQLKGDRSDGA